MSLKHILLSERLQAEKPTCCMISFYDILEKKTRVKESRVFVVRTWKVGRRERIVCIRECAVFRVMRNVRSSGVDTQHIHLSKLMKAYT